jgi:YbbR domain-containing protein
MKVKVRLKKHFLKVLSVVLSVLLWAHVLNSERISFEKNYTLKYILPEGLVFSQRSVQEISIQFNGPRAFIRNFLAENTELLIDIRKFNYRRDATFSIDLASVPIDLPLGIIIEKIVPRKISLRLDKKVSKKIPLRLSQINEIDSPIGIRFNLSEVEVSGPRFLMNDLKFLYLKPVDFDSLASEKMLPVEVVLPDERLVMETTEKLTIFQSLDQSFLNLSLSNHPIKFLASRIKFKASTKVVNAKLLLRDSAKSRSNISSSLQIWADIPENVKGRIEVPLRIIKGQAIEAVEIKPKSIIVNIE